jgi:hypothetical protein
MILPDFPGIRTINQAFNLGALCDPSDPNSIMQAMKEVLLNNRDKYRDSCKAFLKSTTAPMDLYGQVYFKLEKMVTGRSNVS